MNSCQSSRFVNTMETSRVILVLGVTICSVIAGNFAQTQDNYIAVSPIVGSEELYLEIKRLEAAPGQPKEEKPSVKKAICTDITSSAFFSDAYGLDPVDPDVESVRAYVEQNDPKIYRTYYNPEGQNVTSNDTQLKFTNPYTQVQIHIRQNTVYDFAFACLARKRSSEQLLSNLYNRTDLLIAMPESKMIIQYFVSRKYTLDWWIKRGSRRPEGRFVYVSNQNEEMVVLAIAEGPAYLSPFTVYGLKQFEELQKSLEAAHVAASVGGKRSICDWSVTTKVRLCNVMLNANEFRRRYKLLSQEPACAEQDIRFEYKETPTSTKDFAIRQWAIECKVEEIGFKVPRDYYITQAVERHEFFLSALRGTLIVVERHARFSL